MRFRKKLEEVAYYLGSIQIFKQEVIFDEIYKFEVDVNQFLFEHSIKHRRAYYKVVNKGARIKLFYFKEKRYFKKNQKKKEGLE